MSFHLYQINELYSNADGSVQFIELKVGNSNGENLLQGHTISVTQGSTAPSPSPSPSPYTYATGDTTHTYTFPSNLPSTLTANTSVLIATQGFANLGIVTPDYIVPSGFLFINGGTVNYAGVDSITYSALPTDGIQSLNRNGTTGVNSPTDFAGKTGTVPGNVISGTDGADSLAGTAGVDLIYGLAGNDTLTGGAGNDTINGGAGVDTAVFGSNRAASTITKTTSGYTVSGPDGTVAVSNIERLQFSDKKFALDLDAGQAGGNTVRIIGAAFDAPVIQQHPDYVGIGLNFFDSGKSMLEVCQLVVQIMGLSNTAFVTTVYTNVVGVAPSAADRDYYVGLLQGSGGTMTQADLLVLAANADINAQNINLVGLQASGVEFV